MRAKLTGESDVVRKRPGDEVFSGSFATTGTGRCVAEKVQQASFANQITAGARSFRRVITPLQGEINLVIRVVLGIVIYLEILLVIRGMVQTMEIGEVVADATLLAGLVPNGLFVSIAVALLQVPPARAFFQLISPDPREGLFVLVAVIAWLLIVRTFWARRVVERFLGF